MYSDIANAASHAVEQDSLAQALRNLPYDQVPVKPVKVLLDLDRIWRLHDERMVSRPVRAGGRPQIWRRGCKTI